MNTTRIILSVLGVVYYTGILWTLLITIYLNFHDFDEDFNIKYELDKNSPVEN